jgi:hypothetical protein
MTKEERDKCYDRMIASVPGAIRKGATNPYTSMNGNMYSILAKGEFVGLRLPDAEREKFIRQYKTKLVEQYGVIQKEYVVVPDTLLKKTDDLKAWFAISYAYVSSLKAKPTTQPAKAGGAKKGRRDDPITPHIP